MSVDKLPAPVAVPRHIAIVMDGNGRWAKSRLLPRTAGHREGVKSVRRVVKSCFERGVEVLSLFAFSSENWCRPKVEVSLLMELFLTTLQRETERLHGNNVRLRFVGERSAFSESLQKHLEQAERLTAANTGLTLVIAANYGGRWDIAHAARTLAREVETGRLRADDITTERLHQAMSLSDLPEPDLFIRTGGEQRVSNFLLWQMAYTEFYFTEQLWPDFGAEALDQAIASYARRQRRFGRTGDQIEQENRA